MSLDKTKYPMFFVEVILPLALAKTFTYQVSETEYHFIKKGMRLAVPFGKSKIPLVNKLINPLVRVIPQKEKF